MRISTMLVVLITGLLSTYSIAQQQRFERQQTDGANRFEYQWRDTDDQPQGMAFSLSHEFLFSQFREFIPYQQQRLDNEILMAVREKAASADARDIRIQAQHGPGGLNIRYRANDDATISRWQRQLQDVAAQTREAFLHRHYYIPFSTNRVTNGIKPDHVRFIQQSHTLLAPVAQALKATLPDNPSEADLINRVASFVQSIPYNTLEDRRDSSGAGFLPPNLLLYNNQGDCDSKAVLAAALLKQLLPERRQVMVYLPEHALLGVQKANLTDEQRSFEFQGNRYVYLEVAGPAVVPLGTLSDYSQHAVNTGQQTIEVIGR